MAFFDNVTEALPDPILGLTVAFRADQRPEKVNLGVGAYKTDELQPLVLSAVRKAERKIVEQGLNKEYLGIDGNAEYVNEGIDLVFGGSLARNRVFGAQTPGGTAALRVAGEFLKQEVTDTIYVSDPTWANHAPVFTRAGLKVEKYPYYDAEKKAVRTGEMLAAIDKMPAGCALLMHACCHNPTGTDPTEEEWRLICDAVTARGVLPFFDFAYQGFGRGLDEDAAAVRRFAAEGLAMVVTGSFSKNFGLYGERVGALYVAAANADAARAVGTQVKRIIRANYSNPPVHGSRLVAAVLSDPALRREWEEELASMRGRLGGMRRQLAEGLAAGGRPKAASKTAPEAVDFSFLTRQYGMFSLSGLTKEQVEKLRTEYSIYMPLSGRINVAGLSPRNLDYVVNSILSVIIR